MINFQRPNQCPQNEDEKEKMKVIPYSSLVSSLMYARVCPRLDLTYIGACWVGTLVMLGPSYWKSMK